MTPLVSILIPCHNAERWVGQAIESALAQSLGDCEVIVVDDGSTDGGLEVIRSFGERIRFESGPNRGGNAARNRLMELARGEWLQYLDADDYLLPEKVEEQLKFAGQHAPEADVIYSPSIIREEKEPEASERVLDIPEPHDPWVLLARWYLPQTGAALWRRSTVQRAGGWKIDQPCCQEHELYCRLLQAGAEFVYCPSAKSVYRQWSSETTCRKDPGETRRRRLEVIANMEQHLKGAGELTPLRANAVAAARLEIARSMWGENREEARRLAAEARRSAPMKFEPSGNAFPPLYRRVYGMFGFELAERVAGLRRALAGK
jgi:glycosyltransferase involved in cell wall biosynthesis